MYFILNGLLHILHISIVLFFVFGWIFPITQFSHSILTLFILLSWFVLGIKFGFGYCAVTDMQWRLKKKFGHSPYTEYYMKYIFDKITKKDLNATKINNVTTSVFFIILLICLWQNIVSYF